MKNGIAITLLATTIVAGSARYFSSDKKPELAASSASHASTVTKNSTPNDRPSNLDESEIIQARTRTNESFESEFRSYSNKELRKELDGIATLLDPILELSNKQALSLSQRVTITNGLRKRQALLKILIDRRIELAEQRRLR